MKFRVGDKVRLTAEGARYLYATFDLRDASEGMIGNVLEPYEDGIGGGALVEFPTLSQPRFGDAFGEDEGWAMTVGRIELVEAATTTFNVGDRVLVRRVYSYGSTSVGVLFHGKGDALCVRYDNSDSWDVIEDGNVEIIKRMEASSTNNDEGSDSVKRKFAIGDKVRIVGESLEAFMRDEYADSTIDAVGTIHGHNDAYDTWHVLLDDVTIRSPYNDEGVWAIEASDLELIESVAPAKSTTDTTDTTDIVAALVGDDRKASNGGVVVVNGKRIDVEAKFYRMCAKATKRTRRKAS